MSIIRTLAIVLFFLTVWTAGLQAQYPYPDRPLHVRVTGALLPIDQEKREDIITVNVFINAKTANLFGNPIYLLARWRARVRVVEISFYSPRPLPKGARERLFPSRCLEAALRTSLDYSGSVKLNRSRSSRKIMRLSKTCSSSKYAFTDPTNSLTHSVVKKSWANPLRSKAVWIPKNDVFLSPRWKRCHRETLLPEQVRVQL